MTKYASYILFLLIAILVITLNLNGVGPIDSLQRSIDDFLVEFVAPEGPRPNVVIVNIDARAQDELGTWPWNRDLIADLLAATASGEPKSILVDLKLPENAEQDSAGHTDILAEQLKWIDQAILSYDVAPSTFRTAKTNNPDYLFQNSVTIDNVLGEMSERSSLLVSKVFLPAEKLLSHNPYLGFDYDAPDPDHVLRHQRLVMNYEGYYYPSQSLLAASVYLGVPPDMIYISEGQEIRIGDKRSLPVNSSSDFFVSFVKPPYFAEYSAADILGDGFDFGILAGKQVLIGIDDASFTDAFKTPNSESTSTLQIKATVLENIININMVKPSPPATPLGLLALLLIGGTFAYFFPRLSMTHRILFVGGTFVVLVNANYFILTTFQFLPQTVYIGLELFLFIVAAPLLDSQLLSANEATRFAKKKSIKEDKASSDEIIAAPVRELKSGSNDQYDLQTKAIDHARTTKQQSGTTGISTDMTSGTSAFKTHSDSKQEETDSASDIDHQAISLDDTGSKSDPKIIVPDDKLSDSEGASLQPGPSKKLFDKATDIKNLGRYQVEGVLGQGSMGLVYKGIDPAINRPVALKTIRLDFVNDPEEMEELKERLFREAQAAGKLSHPNIVTIYDVGSEDQLQYIAMEYLEGQTLENMIKKRTKFNYRIIAKIINQICAALEYAHEKKIVHRDIKPANIMILNDYTVKVMDYGIARVDSNSMTKTGIAMGTPNYISPEQLKGILIDSRSDLFSLGVVMYEMLLGVRPFRGDNITQLIYAITNHEPEKPSTVSPEVPLLFDHIIAKALKKNAEDRYQKASDITNDLADFVSSFVS